jgi:hypothetical protein
MSELSGLLSVQRQATRDPDVGKAWLEDTRLLEYAYDTTGEGLKLRIPASAAKPVYVVGVAHLVTTAFSGGTPAIDIGDGSDADYYLENTNNISPSTLGHLGRAIRGNKLTANAVIEITLSGGLTVGAAALIARLFRPA